MAGERRLYLERNCRLPESPAHSRRRNREESASSKGLKGQRGFGPAVEPRRKSRPRSTSLHGSSPCKCQRLSTLRWDRLPPSRPSTKSWARAGGRRLSDRRLHRWLAGTSASAPSSHGAADLLGLNRAHICVRNQKMKRPTVAAVLVKQKIISTECAEAFVRIWLSFRNDVHHTNPRVSTVPFRELARQNMVDLAAIEREIFSFTFSNGNLVPVQPRYWDLHPHPGRLARRGKPPGR